MKHSLRSKNLPLLVTAENATFCKPKTHAAKSIKGLLAFVLMVTGMVVSWGQTSYTSTSATSAWNASRWNNSSDGATYTSAYTSNNAVSFTSGTYTFAGMGGLTNVGNVTVASNVTVNFASIGSSFATNGAVRTFDIGSGGLFDFNGQGISTTSGTGFIKTGAGVFATGAGNFTGGFTLNAGTVIARGTTGLGSGTGNILTLNGGTIASIATRDFINTRFPGGIVIGGNVQFGEMATVVSLANSTADLSFANNVSLGSSLRTLTLGNGGIITLSGVISNTASTGITFAANANGTGKFLLSGVNTYTGPTTISSGTLALSGSGSIATSSTITVGSSGKFDVSGLTTALSLTSIQTLKASATGSNTTGTITVISGKSLTLGTTGGLEFTAYGANTTPPLTVTGVSAGALELNSAPIKVTTTTALSVGTYKLIAKSGTATGVSGTIGTLTMAGSGLASGTLGSLSISSGELILTVTSSASSNIILNSGFTHPTNIDYTTYQAASGLTSSNSIEVGQFDIQDGGGSADADGLSTSLTACSLTVANSSNIRALALFDGSTNVGEITTVGATANFSGLTLAAADNGSKTFSVRATFKSAVTDNHQISFTVASASADSSGSRFASADAGAAVTSTAGDNNKIEVASTDIIFVQNVSTVAQNSVMNPSPTVMSIDGNGNYDLDNTSNVALTISTGSTGFDSAATTTVAMVAGEASFSNLIFTTAATSNTLTATLGSYTDISSAFDVTASAPEINVKQGATSLASNIGTYAAGNIVSGNSSSPVTFTIENIGSANLTYSSITTSNTTDFTIDLTTTSSPIAASGTSTFTVTFNPTTAGAKSTTITINNNDADEGTYTFTVTGTGTVSAASDIISNAGYLYNSNIDYASYQIATSLTTVNSIGVNGLTLRDGAITTDTDNLGTTLSSITFSTGSSTAIRTAALFDGSTNIAEVAVNGGTSIAFTGLSLSASDNNTKDFELRVTYQSTVTDNQQVTFTVSAATASATASGFATATAGAAASSTTIDINRLEVTATILAFVQQASNVSINIAMTSAPTVSANDGNGNRDLDYITDMTATTSSTFAGASTNTITPVAGIGTFSNLQFSAAGTGNTIDVSSGSISNTGNSGTFTIYEAQPLTQASSITFANVGMNSMTINWINGSGSNRIVVVKATGTPGTSTDGVTYSANTVMGSGSTFSASEYVVYNGTGNTVDITNLLGSTTYSVKVFEYNGSAGTENYLTTSNNTSQTTASLSYYSNGSGDPAVLASWNTLRNGTGSSPSNFTTGETFIIESGDNMTTTNTWTVNGTASKLKIESGGTLTANNAITLAAATTFQIDNGGIYIHNNTGTPSSTIFAGTEIFGASSNVRIDNWTSNSTVITTGVTLPFGNLEINYTSNTQNWQNSLSGTINLTGGNFTVTSLGLGSLRFAAAGAPTITVAGNYTQAAGVVNLASSTGSSITTLNIGGDFAVNGGTFTSTSTGSKVVFNKSGSQSFTNAGTISTVNFEVGSSSILDLGTSVLPGGSFTILSGATLKTAHASGFSGAITATTKTFSSAANYEFNGSATGTFTTSPTANTVNNLTINRSAGVALSQDLAVAGTFTQTSGKLAIGANTLTLNGTYVGDATNSLTVGSTSNITTTGTSGTLYFDQTTPGTTNVLQNLTISGSGTATLGNALNITAGSSSGTVTVGTGATLTTGDNLILKSDANGTARVGNSAGTISGNVTVERYIPAKRAWRALTAPVSTTSSIYVNWQEAGTSNGTNGIEIWAPTAGTGLTQGGISNSLLSYNSTGSSWTGIATTDGVSSMMNGTKNKPFMAFVTGPYGSGNITAGATATTLRATGALFTGTQTYASATGEYTFIGNPYASPLDISLMMNDTDNSAFGTTIWVWDAKAAGTYSVGAYNTYDISNGSYTNITNPAIPGDTTLSAGTLVQSGQAFFVEQSSGSSVDFKIKEAHKGTTFSNAVFRQSSVAETLRVGLYKQTSNEWSGRDGAMAVFLSDAEANQTPNKMANGSENVAFTKNGILFASEHHLPLVASDVLNVKVWNTTAGANYKLKINTEQFNTTNLNATLEDVFTNSRTPLALDGTAVEYPFVVTTEAASTGNRFRIVFETNALGINNPKASGITILPNPITGDAFQVNLGTLGTGTYAYTISNALGQEVEKGSINNVMQNTNYTVKFKNSTAAGMYIMKVIGADNSVFTAKIIKK